MTYDSDIILNSYEVPLPSSSFAVFSEDSTANSTLYVESYEIDFQMEEVYQHGDEIYYKYEMTFQLDTQLFPGASEVTRTFWSSSDDLNATDLDFMRDAVVLNSADEEIYVGDLKSDLLGELVDEESIEDRLSHEIAFTLEEQKALSGLRLDRDIFHELLEETGLNLDEVYFFEIDTVQGVSFSSSGQGFDSRIHFVLR